MSAVAASTGIELRPVHVVDWDELVLVVVIAHGSECGCSLRVWTRRLRGADCLYLDMNGIIHNCTHSDKMDPSIVLTNDQMMTKVRYGGHVYPQRTSACVSTLCGQLRFCCRHFC